MFAQFVLFLLIGVMLFTFYQQTPLPVPLGAHRRNPAASSSSTTLATALAGFIVAAIVAAALSPSINAMAATTVNDFYLQYVNPDADEATLMRVSQQATLGWGIVQIGRGARRPVHGRVGPRRRPAVLSLPSGSVLGAFLIGTLAAVGRRQRHVRRA